MLRKFFNENKVIFKRLGGLFLVGIIIISAFLVVFGIDAYKRKIEYCKTNRDYIKVYVDAAMLGKLDDGEPQKDENGNLKIDFSKTSFKSTVNYRGKECECFKLTDFTGEYQNLFGLEDIRGDFLNEETKLKVQPFYYYFNRQKIPVCPFSTEKKPYYYCILEDGTVICSCPECQ
ncbi:MAG: hypothetical protein ACI4IF_02935 [Acutalibacteraceae bacterium]